MKKKKGNPILLRKLEKWIKPNEIYTVDQVREFLCRSYRHGANIGATVNAMTEIGMRKNGTSTYTDGRMICHWVLA